MKNLIFGASGATGHNLVSQALGLKHLVSTFLRSPSRLRFRDDNIRIIEGDVSDYINRAGKNLPARKKSVLEKAKNKLRQLFGSKHPSYPVPYAKDFEERELYRDTYDNYNDPSYYPIKRREFGHGQSGNMNPGLIENYGETSFRGFHNASNVGRDYESNIGYRENYNKLDSRPGPGYEYEFAQLRRQQIGSQRGKGPRSYKRTDDRILEDINDRLCDNPYLDASDMEVSVKDHEVILTGSVESREAKRLAEDIAEEVTGVENVENRLHVKIKGV